MGLPISFKGIWHLDRSLPLQAINESSKLEEHMNKEKAVE